MSERLRTTPDNKSIHLEGLSFSHFTGETLRVGDDVGVDFFTDDGRRWYGWQQSVETDSSILKLLCDPTLGPCASYNGISYNTLLLPNSGRPAVSVLAGSEAWEGEKQGLFEAILGKIVLLHDLPTPTLNASTSLDTTAASREDTDVLVLPPYDLRMNPDGAEVESWLKAFSSEIKEIIGNNPGDYENVLLSNFENRVRDIWLG